MWPSWYVHLFWMLALLQLVTPEATKYKLGDTANMRQILGSFHLLVCSCLPVAGSSPDLSCKIMLLLVSPVSSITMCFSLAVSLVLRAVNLQ